MSVSIFTISILISSLLFLFYLRKKQKSLSFRVLISLPLGIACGVFFSLFPKQILLLNILELISQGYLSLLKMLVIPLIFTSIIYSILCLGKNDEQFIKKLSLFTCGILLLLTSIASFIGLTVGNFFQVGVGLNLPDVSLSPQHVYPGLTDALLAMIPKNPVAAMANGNTIAVVIFAMLFGLAARSLNHKQEIYFKMARELFATLFGIIKKLTQFILELTPYGILALLSQMVLTQGMILLKEMFNFIVAMYVAMFLMIMLHTMLLIIFGYRPWSYFKKALTPLLIAFTTRSSFGTLPAMENTLQDKFKIDQGIATFVPTIGATIGMNACAGIFPAMLVMMCLNMTHQTLTLPFTLMVVIINAIASIGLSGIPGTAYIAATISLTSLNLPFAVVALVQGIDPLVDMGRTATNVNGIMTTALLTDRLIGEKENQLITETIADITHQ